MNILAIETATTSVGCAVGDETTLFVSFEAARGRQHAELLTPSIDYVLRTVDMTMKDINAIAVDIGPGLFTGLRVGISAAKAMAYALNVPIVGVSSLDAMAYSLRWSNRMVVPVIDGRRSEVFTAQFHGERISDYAVTTPAALAEDLADRDAVLFGDGAVRYLEAFGSLDVDVSAPQAPSAVSVLELGRVLLANGGGQDADKLEPLYLRKSDAEVNRDLSVLGKQ